MARRQAHRCSCKVRERGTLTRRKTCNQYGRAVRVRGIQHDITMSMCARHRRMESKNYQVEVLQ